MDKLYLLPFELVIDTQVILTWRFLTCKLSCNLHLFFHHGQWTLVQAMNVSIIKRKDSWILKTSVYWRVWCEITWFLCILKFMVFQSLKIKKPFGLLLTLTLGNKTFVIARIVKKRFVTWKSVSKLSSGKLSFAFVHRFDVKMDLLCSTSCF